MHSQVNDKKSENEISVFTDKIVFKGGLGLNHNSISTNTNIFNITNNISNNNHINIGNVTIEKEKDLTGPVKITQTQKITQMINEPNFSCPGNLSFRSRKDSSQCPPYDNYAQIHIPKNEPEVVDPLIITKSIVEKLGKLKNKTSKKKINELNMLQGEEIAINKMFITKPQIKENEIELKNFDNFPEKKFNNNIASNEDEEEDLSSHEEVNEDEFDDEEENASNENKEEGQNCFWNLNSDEGYANKRERSKSCTNAKKDESSTAKKGKYLNSIICTLSRIEKGKAIFVSMDDLIFVLPAMFVPRNLIVGNTYIFRISEHETFQKKFLNIHNLQKKYCRGVSQAFQK